MKEIVLLIVLFVFPAIAYTQPSIVFDSGSYDAGTVVQGATVEHTFEVSNAGDEELVIRKLTPS